MMSKQTDPEYLKYEAYEDADDLKIRIDIQARFSTNPVSWYRWLLEKLELPEDGRVLDLGSGPGDLWADHTHQIPKGISILLSDLSHGMLRDARENLASRTNSFSFCVLDAQSLPFPVATYDCVIGSGLLDHLSDRDKGLSEIWQVLKPDGRFYTTCGSQTHLQEIQSLVEPFLKDVEYGGDPDRFGLENGREILSNWFSQVSLVRYKDTLIFNQPEPILLYLFSEAEVRQALDIPSRRSLANAVTQQISQEGEIRVQVEKGLFKSVKG
jgi:ubiquinone/menaquinone biosynthesis C-methylase UbiE